MSVYLYTLRKSKPTTRTFKGKQLRIYKYKFATANATSNWNQDDVEKIIYAATKVWSGMNCEWTDKKTPILVDYFGSIYLQNSKGKSIQSSWYDCNDYYGIEVGEFFNGKPFFNGDGVELIEYHFGSHSTFSLL